MTAFRISNDDKVVNLTAFMFPGINNLSTLMIMHIYWHLPHVCSDILIRLYFNPSYFWWSSNLFSILFSNCIHSIISNPVLADIKSAAHQKYHNHTITRSCNLAIQGNCNQIGHKTPHTSYCQQLMSWIRIEAIKWDTASRCDDMERLSALLSYL